jgi:polygalacturonase
MIRQGNSYWQEETNKSEQKEKDRQNLLENATTSKASDEYENELRPLEVQIPQIDVNANMNASGSSGTDNSSFVRQLMAGSPKGGGV